MRAVDVAVLAAGVGSRLRPLTDNVPKCLVPIGEQTILGRLMAQLSQVATEVDMSVHVVAGYRAEQVYAATARYNGLVSVIENTEYASTNNMYSLHLALRRAKPWRPLIVVNGDCVYESEIVKRIFAAGQSSIVVDSSVFYAESMKIKLQDGCARGISKQFPNESGVVTSIDLYRFEPDAREKLANTVERYIRSGERTHWTEIAINDVLTDNSVCVKPLDITGYHWFEIDTIADLNAAKQLFAKVRTA